MIDKKSSSTANTKKRNWAFVGYPESLPADWKDKLQATGLQCAISPLHDRDINPDNTPKKPHFHIILCYAGPTSYNVVKRLTDEMHAPIPQPLEQIKGYYRYLTHKDNPEKYQYSEQDITTINGFNILDFIELSRQEITAIKKELQGVIRQKGFLEYSDFMEWAYDEGTDQQYDVASSNTIFFNSLLTSARHRAERIKTDPETGEVI